MRKLTVKNFSVIKEAELEFGKITVLIGPQSSGKSLLCKLAFFFAQIVPEIVEGCLQSRLPLGSCIERIENDFRAKFPTQSWRGEPFRISYESNNYTVLAEQIGPLTPLSFDLGTEFDTQYPTWIDDGPGVTHSVDPSRVRRYLERQGTSLSGPPLKEYSIYIPTGRSFYSTPSRGLAALATKNLDWITQRYATEFDPDFKALLESYESNLPVLSEFGRRATEVLKGKVIREEGRLLFRADGARTISFELLSSGTLELLPLSNTLSQLAKIARFPNTPPMPAAPFGVVFIEEPELGVFPSTQNQIVRMLAWLNNEQSVDISYAITTHSPYILAAFNNLIEAGQVARDNPGLHDHVAKIIPEQYWIREGDFKAYAIEDGKLKSILNESGFIEGNYLDQVSEVIGNEFDELLRLEYDNTKAS